MTVIAWDGTTLAADKRAVCNGFIRTTTKIKRIRDMLVGCAGDLGVAAAMMAWIERGCDESKYPDSQKDTDDMVSTIIIWPDKTIWRYEITPFPFRIEDTVFAIGSGRDYAIGAMSRGATAKEAVFAASLYDIYCGNGIDELQFN